MPARKTINYHGKQVLLADLLLEHEVTHSTFLKRVANGMTIDEALAKPSKGEVTGYFYTVDGVEYTTVEVARHLGCTVDTVLKRKKKGWSDEDIWNIPVDYKRSYVGRKETLEKQMNEYGYLTEDHTHDHMVNVCYFKHLTSSSGQYVIEKVTHTSLNSFLASHPEARVVE